MNAIGGHWYREKRRIEQEKKDRTRKREKADHETHL